MTRNSKHTAAARKLLANVNQTYTTARVRKTLYGMIVSELGAIDDYIANLDKHIDELARVVESSKRAITVLTKENKDLRVRLAVAERILAMKKTEART